jgi:hypothetical protein
MVLFQNPRQTRLAKYLNLNARKSRFSLFQNQVIWEHWPVMMPA